VSAFFTMTPDLRSEFPARAARDLGWDDVPMLCTTEVDVRGALPRCIRALVHASSDRPRGDVRHVYLRGAHVLRPDLADGGRQPAPNERVADARPSGGEGRDYRRPPCA